MEEEIKWLRRELKKIIPPKFFSLESTKKDGETFFIFKKSVPRKKGKGKNPRGKGKNPRGKRNFLERLPEKIISHRPRHILEIIEGIKKNT